MPFESRAQARFMYAHKDDPGKTGAAAREFISASHGMKLSKLPERVKSTKPKKPKRMPMFGSLVPHSAGHYIGDVPTGPEDTNG